MQNGVGAALGTLAVVAVGALSFAHGVHPTPAPVHYAHPVAHLHNVQTIPVTSTAVAKANTLASTTPGTQAATWACEVTHSTNPTASTTMWSTGYTVVYRGTCVEADTIARSTNNGVSTYAQAQEGTNQ